MRSLILACLFLLPASPLFAGDPKATVFPPTGCSNTVPSLMSWMIGDTSTRCKTGQDVLKLALPNCAIGQQVVYDGQMFLCEDKPSSTQNIAIPNCDAEQFVTARNGVLGCGTPNATTTITRNITRNTTTNTTTPTTTGQPKLATLSLTCSNVNADDPSTSPIISYYKTYLGRCADDGGLAYYIGQIASGVDTLASVKTTIQNSSEARDFAANGAASAQLLSLCAPYPGYSYKNGTQYCYPDQ